MEHELFEPSTIGRKIEGVRRIKGISQEILAANLGISRQGFSKMIQSGNIDDEKLEQIAKALGVSTETIKNFNEESFMHFIQNNYEGSNNAAPYVFGSINHFTVNPIEKLMEMVEENKSLYQQLLKSEKEKVAILQKQLASKFK